MKPGDVIFFSDKDLEDKPNILGQWALTRQREQWTHVAISLYGPLIVHAMPDGGVHFSVLEEDLKKGTRYVLARPLAASDDPQFEKRLEDASVYWAGEEYAILSIYRKHVRGSGMVIGQSFCSYVIQKIFSEMLLDPFQTVERPLVPTQLYNQLFDHADWTILGDQPLMPEAIDPTGPNIESVLLDAKMRCRMLTIQATLTPAAGGISVAAKVLADMAVVTAFTSGTTAREKMKQIKRTIAPLKSVGYESNMFFQYRNILPFLLTENGLRNFELPENRSWLYRDWPIGGPMNIANAVEQALDFEISQLEMFLQALAGPLERIGQASVEGKQREAVNLVATIASFLDAIGAEEILMRPLSDSIQAIELDLENIKNCNHEDGSDERIKFAAVIEAKRAFLERIENLALAAGADWPPAIQ